jgi:hypothetical protein
MTTNSSGNFHNGVVRRESSQHDHSAAQRVLREAIERQQIGLEGLQAARDQLLTLFERIERLGGQIDEAFGGNPFLPDVPANSPANRGRFNAFLDEHRQLTRLFGRAVELWMLTCGMKREDDWVSLLIAQMQQKATVKATESNASQSGTGVMSSGVPDSASRRRHVC